MAAAASSDGLNIYVVSGFRSYNTQNTLYNNYVNRDGRDAADTYSAITVEGNKLTVNFYTIPTTGTNAGKQTLQHSWGIVKK